MEVTVQNAIQFMIGRMIVWAKKFSSIKEAAKASGISYMVLYMRLRAGKPVSRALNTPVRKYKKAA